MIDYQDLEDRIASLERITRNIGIGKELVVGSLHALDKVTADEVTANEAIAKKPPFNIKAWGAKGDNSTDDDTAIQAAIDAAYNDGGGTVYFPALGTGANDRYKIDEPVYLKDGVSFLGDHAAYSRISAHASDGSAYHAVDYSGSEPQDFFIKNLTIGFEDHYDNADARCIDFSSPATKNYLIENVILKHGYYGYYDDGGGFLGVFLRVSTSSCKNGFYKHGGGSAHQFYNCYAWGTKDSDWDGRAWDIDGGVAYLLQACGMEKYYSNTEAIAYFRQNHSLTINGFAIEDCEAETNGNCIVMFDENFSTHVTGIKDVTCVINAAGSGNTRLIKIVENRIHLSGCEIGAGTTVNAASGAAAGYAIDIEGTLGDPSRVTFTASSIADPTVGTNAPTVSAIRLATAAKTIEVTLDNVLAGTILNPNDNAIGVARPDYIHIRDQKTVGTDGGTFTTGAWRERDLNTEVSDTGGHASFDGNEIVLAAGTYRCLISVPARQVNHHIARLQNTTDAATLLVGTSALTGSGDTVMTRSFIVGRFTLAAQKNLSVQHRCQTTKADNGYGSAANQVVPETYAEVQLWKEL